MLELVSAQPGARALDLGCGPGTLTVPLAEAVGPEGRVLALDLADGMLSVVRETAPPWVEAQRMDIERLHLPSRSFDLAVSGHAYQFVPDLVRALGEARRVLDGGGRFAASVPVGGGRGAADAVGDLIAELPPAPTLDDRHATYETLSDDIRLGAAMQAAGFTAIAVERCTEEVRHDTVDTLVGATVNWWGFAWRLDQLAPAEREQFVGRLRQALAERITDWPYVAVNVNTVFSGRT